jgi:crotonobetainyl-CoA:carnitine CoA-transferase CaiB-like acyl-CoA transferase
VTALTPQQWEGLCALIGLPDLAREPRFATTDLRLAASYELDGLLGPALAKLKTAAMVEEGQRRRLPLAPVPTMAEVLATPHWRARGSFVPVDGGAFEAPGLPFRLHHRPIEEGTRRRRPEGQGPLAGVRVLDLSMGWSGPLAARHFADLGAEVIKVEGTGHLDWWRGWNALEAGDPPPYETRPNFNAVNRNKRGITLDLRSARGVALLKGLAAEADLLVENYAPGVLDKLGLGAAAMARVNPALSYISMGAFGSAGPWAGFRAYGSTTEQAAGMPFLHGEADWPPAMQHTAYGDPIAGLYAAAALLAALWGRERLGAATIDLSQVECLFQLAADGIVAQSATGGAPPRTGSVRAAGGWRGCVRGAGKDAWLAVDLADTADAARLAAVCGGVDGLADWAGGRAPAEAAAGLQAAGVAAAPVVPATALLGDPQLVAAGYWVQLARRHVGQHVVPKAPYALDGVVPPVRTPAPTLGEHSAAVLGEFLGLTADDIAALEGDGVIGTRAA